MKVAAIMPTYNQSSYLAAAIESVLPQVDRLIVVDDGSTDRTPEILLTEYGWQVSRVTLRENRGTAAAINAGYSLVGNAELVTWVSSDNVYSPDWRETLEAQFAPGVGAVYSGFHKGGGPTRHTPYQPGALIETLNCFFGPSFLIRRSVWDHAGAHRGAISHDYDHWLRVEEACWDLELEIRSIPDDLCFYRVHEERATVLRRHEFDAHKWQAVAQERRR